MTAEIIHMTAQKPPPKISEEELARIDRIFELVAAPIITPGTTMSFMLDHKKGINPLGITLLYTKARWFASADRQRINKIAAGLSGVAKHDWSAHCLMMSFQRHSRSAHEIIEDRAELVEIFKARGGNWQALLSTYDKVLARVEQSRTVTTTS